MLAMLGGVMFTLAPLNYDSLSASSSASHARHDVPGTGPIYEHTGDAERSIEIKGKVFPEFSGGVPELMALEALRASGEPQHLMFGSGFAGGWVIIEKIAQDHSHIGFGGTGREVGFTLSLKRCDLPQGLSIGDLLGQFFGAFDVVNEYLG